MGLKVSEIGEDLNPSLDDFIYLLKSPITSDSSKRVLLSKILALAESPIKRADVTLNDAAIKALPTTPYVTVAAPGGGKYIQVVAAYFRVNTLAGAYTNVSGARWQLLATSSQWPRSHPVPMGNLLEAPPRDALIPFLIPFFAFVGGFYDTTNASVNIPAVGDNAPVVIYDPGASGGNYTGGNSANTLKVTTLYTVNNS